MTNNTATNGGADANSSKANVKISASANATAFVAKSSQGGAIYAETLNFGEGTYILNANTVSSGGTSANASSVKAEGNGYAIAIATTQASGQGGAIYARVFELSNGTYTLSNNVASNEATQADSSSTKAINRATAHANAVATTNMSGQGGAIYAETLTLDKGTYTLNANTASSKKAVAKSSNAVANGSFPWANMNASASTVITKSGQGGAIYAKTLTLSHGTYTMNGNTASGGSANANSSSAYSNNDIDSKANASASVSASALGQGGAIYADNVTFAKGQYMFKANIAQSGSAEANALGAIQDGSSNAGASADVSLSGQGGAIFAANQITMNGGSSTFTLNQAIGGQAITQQSTGTPAYAKAIAKADNSGLGGAILTQGTFNLQGNLIFINNSATTVNQNDLSSGRGGAIFADSNGQVSLTHSLIADVEQQMRFLGNTQNIGNQGVNVNALYFGNTSSRESNSTVTVNIGGAGNIAIYDGIMSQPDNLKGASGTTYKNVAFTLNKNDDGILGMGGTTTLAGNNAMMAIQAGRLQLYRAGEDDAQVQAAKINVPSGTFTLGIGTQLIVGGGNTIMAKTLTLAGGTTLSFDLTAATINQNTPSASNALLALSGTTATFADTDNRYKVNLLNLIDQSVTLPSTYTLIYQDSTNGASLTDTVSPTIQYKGVDITSATPRLLDVYALRTSEKTIELVKQRAISNVQAIWNGNNENWRELSQAWTVELDTQAQFFDGDAVLFDDAAGGTQNIDVDVNGVTTAGMVVDSQYNYTFSGGVITATTNPQFTSLIDPSLATGALRKSGIGILTVDNVFIGNAHIEKGKLVLGSTQANQAAQLKGNITIAGDSILAGHGVIKGDVIAQNDAIVSPGNSIGVLTIEGNYHGDNSILALDAVLDTDGARTDKLVVLGNTTGRTRVRVANVGGNGAQTVEGLEVIRVQGNSQGDFVQEGRIVAGAYDYTLGRGKNGKQNNWYLSSFLSNGPVDPVNPIQKLRPEFGGYIGLIENNQTIFNGSLYDRQAQIDRQGYTNWVRVAANNDRYQVGQEQLHNKATRAVVQFGGDIYTQGVLHLGIMAGFSQSKVRTHSRLNGYVTKANSDGYAVGIYSSWLDRQQDQSGWYVDSYLQYRWFKNQLNGQDMASERFNSHGLSVSAELGYGFLLRQYHNTQWIVEPQLQLLYNQHNGKVHREENGSQINLPRANDYAGRIGLRFSGHGEEIKPFIGLNYWQHSLQANIKMDGVNVSSQKARKHFEVKTGFELKLAKDMQLYGQIEAKFGKDNSRSYGGNIGVKVSW